MSATTPITDHSGAANGEPPVTLALSAMHAAAGRVRVYRGATVVDGTGAERRVADVAVEGSRIVLVHPALAARVEEEAETDAATSPHPLLESLPEGAVEIDATGLVLAPGFIDMHAHSDLAVMDGAAHTAKLLQGVTTEVIGQDGLGYAPVDDVTAVQIAGQIAGWNGRAAPFAWRTMGEFLDVIDERTAGNVAALVPQGNLRMSVVGHENRPATAEELRRMGEMLGAALDEGAFGMSSGLTYTPGMYAETAELEYLCRIVAERGGYWAPHTRSYGGAALDAYAEAIEIGRRTGCPIHLTHATMNFRPNRGRADELLALVDAAIADGVDVTLDTYPYLPGATTLTALLPSRLAEGGDLLQAIAALDANGRERVRVEVDELGCDGFHGEPADWSTIEISGVSVPELEPLVGRRVSEIAESRGARPIDVVLDTILADGGATGILMHIGDENNVRAIMRHPRHCGGSDGILIGSKPHPRGFGTFPRYLGHYVRDLGVLSLEEAIRHLSGTPAERLGLHRGDAPRGVIRAGATADLVLFDPETIAAGATFDAPRSAPEGVVEVLVAGEVVVRNGVTTGALPGRALRMPPPAHRATLPLMQTSVDADGAVVRIGATVHAPEELSGIRELLTEALEGAAAAAAAVDGDEEEGVSITLRIDPALGIDAANGGRVADEAFRVRIAADGIVLEGAAPIGVFRAFTVLRQLAAPETGLRGVLPLGEWSGAPAYAWRGLMLDVARHFRPAADVRRLIDLLADHHLTVLHLHLSDDQGWRFEVPGYPRLTEIGARREATQRGHGVHSTVEPGLHEGYYTTDELHELVAYASARYITLVPEVELPGHVQAALAAYPELGNLDAQEPPTGAWERFGVNIRTLAPTEQSLAFGYAAIDALCEAFDSPWIGIGGDEVPTDDWAQSAQAAIRMDELGMQDVHEIQPWFTQHFVAHVRSRGRIPLAWDEVLEGDVPEGTRIMAWRGPVALAEAIARGIPVIACPDLEVYFDYRQEDIEDEPSQVGPPLTIEHAYTLTLPAEVDGGQANVWTEHLPTRDRVDYAIFPRLAATAERLWAGGAPGEIDDFARRLPVYLRRLSAAGVAYRRTDGPLPEQRRPGVPGKPMTVAQREAIVEGLVANIRR